MRLMNNALVVATILVCLLSDLVTGSEHDHVNLSGQQDEGGKQN
jgi:hypothetical protein